MIESIAVLLVCVLDEHNLDNSLVGMSIWAAWSKSILFKSCPFSVPFDSSALQFNERTRAWKCFFKPLDWCWANAQADLATFHWVRLARTVLHVELSPPTQQRRATTGKGIGISSGSLLQRQRTEYTGRSGVAASAATKEVWRLFQPHHQTLCCYSCHFRCSWSMSPAPLQD